MDTIDLTKKLVEINSVTGNEAEICSFVESYLKENGVSTERVAIDGSRYNLVSRIGSGQKKLILCTHFDTVPPHIPLTEKDGKLYGRGTCDAKCHLATALNTLIELSKENLNGELIFITVIGEEIGGKDGIQKVMQELKPGADAAIVLEPMNLRLAIAQVGVIWVRLEMVGKEMHVTQAQGASNIVEEMAKLIVKLKEEFPKRFNTATLVGKPQLNITVFHGGETANVLPGKCTVDIDIRYTVNETDEDIYNFLEDCMSESSPKPKLIKVAHRNPVEISKESDIVKTFQKVNPSIELFGYEAVTDANNFNEAGITPVIFGCGSMKLAHTMDEHVEIEDVKKEEETLKKVCREFFTH